MEQTNQQVDSSPEIETTTQTPQDEHNQNEAQAKKTNDNELNIRTLRQEKERLSRERDEYQRKLQEYEQARTKQTEPERNPSDLVEWGDVQREMNKLKEEINSYKQQSGTATTEMKLKSQFPDIESVLTPENIERLKQEDPELAAMINESSNLYTKASVAYKAIKKTGIYADKSYDKDKETIAANTMKPRSSSAVNKSSPLTGMNDFVEDTDAYRKRLYKEMVEAARNK